jgi:signal transduction histidine kinase
VVTTMEITRKPKYRFVKNPHFWAILVLMILITIVYYSNLFETSRFSWLFNLTLFEFNYHIHGILYNIPFVYATLIFWWKGAIITWLLAAIFVIPRILYFHHTVNNIVTNLVFLAVPMVIVFYFVMELRWREKTSKVTAEREVERQEYMSQIFRAQEDERQRIARELHDDTLQTLLVIATRAEELASEENVRNVAQLKEKAEWIRNTSLLVSQELRRLSLELRPAILDNLGLIPAIRWLANGLSQNNINSHFEVIGVPRKLSPEIDINVFRIVQEALNNIKRHSKATEATIILEFTPDSAILKIRDNGKGFTSTMSTGELTENGKLGLLGMQQRVKSIQGTFNLVSVPYQGTEISIKIKT